MRSSMKAVLGVCQVQTEECTVTSVPQQLELVYLGPKEEPMHVCPACMKHRIKSGVWSYWTAAE